MSGERGVVGLTYLMRVRKPRGSETRKNDRRGHGLKRCCTVGTGRSGVGSSLEMSRDVLVRDWEGLGDLIPSQGRVDCKDFRDRKGRQVKEYLGTEGVI